MQLKLYKTNDNDNVINKTLTNELVLDIVLKRDVDITYPDFILEVVSGYDFRDFNYCIVSDLSRSYFIRRVETLSNEISKLSCECDVLETYKASILISSGNFHRAPKSGDYGPIDTTETGRVVYSELTSDTEMVKEDDAILSVVRWKNG